MITRAETAPGALMIILIGWSDRARHLQAARGGKHSAHWQVGQPQVVLLPTHRDDHGESTKIGAEGVAVDSEGPIVLDKLEHMGFARDLEVLRLAIKEESNLVHHIPVKESKHSAEAEVGSHLKDSFCIF